MRKPATFVLLAALAVGCGDTGGRQVALRTEARADAEAAGPFTTATGWSVRLTRAAVSLGALYYFDGAPAFVRAKRRGATWLAQLAPLGVARAHPGHYAAGDALGQMLVPAAVDLLAGAAALPEGRGVTGTYRSARLVLASPIDDAARAALAGDHVGFVQGVASKGAQTVHFRLAATLAEVSRSAASGQVDGCVFDAREVEGDGLVSVTVRPRVWLNLVDFAGVAPGTAEAPTAIDQGEPARIGFALGLAQLGAYHFSFAP